MGHGKRRMDTRHGSRRQDMRHGSRRRMDTRHGSAYSHSTRRGENGGLVAELGYDSGRSLHISEWAERLRILFLQPRSSGPHGPGAWNHNHERITGYALPPGHHLDVRSSPFA
jgi:hypothetical protein